MRETVYEGQASLAKAAYEAFQRKIGQTYDWSALPEATKEAWLMVVEYVQGAGKLPRLSIVR